MESGIVLYILMASKLLILRPISLINLQRKNVRSLLTLGTEKIYKNLYREIKKKPKSLNNYWRKNKEKIKNSEIKSEIHFCLLLFMFSNLKFIYDNIFHLINSSRYYFERDLNVKIRTQKSKNSTFYHQTRLNNTK